MDPGAAEPRLESVPPLVGQNLPKAAEHKIKMIALSRTFYLDRDDHEEYNVLKCIRGQADPG